MASTKTSNRRKSIFPDSAGVDMTAEEVDQSGPTVTVNAPERQLAEDEAKPVSMTRVSKRQFFAVSAPALAKKLLGCLIVRELRGERLSGRIVETEAYLGAGDEGTPKQLVFGKVVAPPRDIQAGSIQIFSRSFGNMLLAINCRGDGALVGIKSIEPVDGIETMRENRSVNTRHMGLKANKDSIDNIHISSGPTKLCQALDIERKSFNKVDLLESSECYIEKAVSGRLVYKDIGVSTRTGLPANVSAESAEAKLRFYIRNSPFLGSPAAASVQKSKSPKVEPNNNSSKPVRKVTAAVQALNFDTSSDDDDDDNDSSGGVEF